jgi:hypothetical protein
VTREAIVRIPTYLTVLAVVFAAVFALGSALTP